LTATWHAIILAAGRGPADPMARAFGAMHKCAIDIAGTPMLQRVVATLTAHPAISSVSVSIDEPEVARQALRSLAGSVTIIPSAETAATSAIAAVQNIENRFPTLVTTGDHPLLTADMLDCFLGAATKTGADLCVGLATAETILASFPETKRTFLTFGRQRVSGCNLYALINERSVGALSFWSSLEGVRKKPWRLVGAFGLNPLFRYLTGMLDLETAFALASHRLGLTAKPVLMPFAEASIDVDKPSDKELVERILAGRK
jgi:CTP:molybdopterin cytidylyltransferase MocA